jgi:hypothetical protein
VTTSVKRLPKSPFCSRARLVPGALEDAEKVVVLKGRDRKRSKYQWGFTGCEKNSVVGVLGLAWGFSPTKKPASTKGL